MADSKLTDLTSLDSHQEEDQEREQQFMEDKKKKKEDKKKRESSQKVTEQKIKVPESSKPPSTQTPATPGSVSPSPGPAPPPSPCPAAGVAVPPAGNNAKRAAVANGQPPSSGNQPPQQQRYMPREVPPRFRCQQDQKVLLKRGQPPLSSMLLGGGSGRGATPPLHGDAAGPADPNLAPSSSSSPPHSSSSSSSVAAPTTTTTSTYANSTWGAGSGSLPPTQDWEKVIVDGSDLEEWPSILPGPRVGPEGGEGAELDGPNSSSASWSERSIQQPKGGGGVSGTGSGSSESPSPPHSSPPSSSSSLNECVPSGVAWGASSAQTAGTGGVVEGGQAATALYNSKVSPLPGSQEVPGGVSSGGGPGANFHPNTNPSAWPALGQDGTPAGVVGGTTEGGLPSSSSSITPSFSASTTQPLSSINPPGHRPQHLLQDRPTSDAEQYWGGGPGPDMGGGGSGPNAGGADGIMDCVAGGGGGGGGGSGNLSVSSSSSSTSSSWRAMPPPSSDLNTGASKTDGWGGGGGGAQGQEGSVWGFSSHSEKAGSAGDKGWGRGNEGSSNTPAVSQGAWDGGPEGEYGSAVVRGVSGNLAKETSEGGRGGTSSNSSSSSGGASGGGGVSQDAASPTSATTTGAWDNQKQVEGGEGGAEEWGGQGTGGAGGGSRAGSGESNNQQEPSGLRHRSQQGPNAEVALQSMLSRSDLDPRVLSNTGWGQTQIRQNVAWDLEGRPGAGRSDGSGSSASACSSSTMSAGRGSAYPNAGSKTTDPSAGAHMAHINPGPGPVRDGWEGGGGAPQPGRAPPPPGANSVRKPGSLGEEPEGKSTGGGWGDVGPSEVTGKGWGSDDQEWTGDRRGGGARGNWRELGEQGSGGGGGGGGWGGSQEEKGTGSWKEMGRGEGGGWGQRGGGGGGGGDWGQRDAKPVSDGGWSEGRGRGGSNSDDSSWGNMDEGGPQRGWGGGGGGGGGGGDMGGKGHQDWGGGKPHTAQIPNSQAASLKAPNQQQHQSPTQPPPGSMQGGWGRSGGPQPQSQNQSPGWISGPIPQIPGESLEPSGWEEPSPQSISRKMEIDDGTSAWGDPTRYNTKNVNLWDKNSASPGQTQPLQGQPQQVPPPQQQPPRRQQGIPPNRDANPASASGMGPGMWGGSSNMTGQSVDNGTAAWGQSTEPAGWGDPDDTGKAGGWRNPSPNTAKSVSKSVGEGWGKGESSVSASRNPSWEDEDDGGGVWNSAGSQGSNSSYNSVGWSQGHGGKRGNIKGGGGENWMNPMNRQFSNMGLLGEDPSVDKKLDGDRRGMSDYNGEMRRGGRGGAGGYRVPSSKDMGPGDMGPYGDKMAGHGVYGGGGGGGGSGGMPPPRGIPQPGMHPINPSQGLRTQVPHQFLSPQVPGPILKQMPSPGSSVGAVGAGVFPPQLSHQQIAMLSNIYPHVQQFHLACQLLLQQQQQQQQLLQNQRKFPQPQPLRQQADPQQLARIMAILQQQQRQQQGGVGGAGGGGGSSKLSPSHLGGSQSKQPMGDSLPHPGGVGGPLSDLHAKSQGMYSGLAPGGSLSGLELGSMMGGVGPLKDGGGQQSRFKWMMEGHSPAPSPPDTAHHKNGPLPNPIKARGGSPYSQYELLGGEGMGMPPQCPSDWQRTPGSKMGTKTGTSSWPPEFQPGVPWKGIPSADPESDPYMTPGSVLGSPGPASLNDSDHQLLRDHTGPNPSLNTSLPLPGAWPYSASDSPLGNAHSTAKYSDYKPSWPPEPIGHNKPWKTNRNSSQLPRPPPGLTSQKQASPSPWGSGGPRLASSWGGGGRGSQDSQSRFGPGSAWSDGAGSRGSCWLLLSNLTPQIDGSTLRTICMQHGPLLTFHLGLTQGSALIRYSTRQEAAKAQGALHMCVLGNTTILAEFVSEEDVARYFAHSQAGGAEGAGPGVTVGSSGPGAAVASSGGSSPGSERGGGGTTTGGNGGGGGGVLGSVGSSGSGWQSLDGTMSSPEVAAAQGPGLGVFAQWSTNGAGDGGGGGMGGGESSRAGLWGGVTPGYSGSSLWGTPQMEDRHQMGSPAALLPVDLLGGGADSI